MFLALFVCLFVSQDQCEFDEQCCSMLHKYYSRIIHLDYFQSNVTTFKNIISSTSHIYYRVLVDAELMDNVTSIKIVKQLNKIIDLLQHSIRVMKMYKEDIDLLDIPLEKKTNFAKLQYKKVQLGHQLIHLLQSILFEYTYNSVSHLIGALVYRVLDSQFYATFAALSHFNYGMLYQCSPDPATGLLESKSGSYWKAKHGVEPVSAMTPRALTYAWYHLGGFIIHMKLMLYDSTIIMGHSMTPAILLFEGWIKVFRTIIDSLTASKYVKWHAMLSNSIPKEEPLTLQMLNKRYSDPAEKKRILGEKIFPQIQDIEPRLCGKICGMLLEMKNKQIINMVNNREFLELKVNEALQTLELHHKKPERK